MASLRTVVLLILNACCANLVIEKFSNAKFFVRACPITTRPSLPLKFQRDEGFIPFNYEKREHSLNDFGAARAGDPPAPRICPIRILLIFAGISHVTAKFFADRSNYGFTSICCRHPEEIRMSPTASSILNLSFSNAYTPFAIYKSRQIGVTNIGDSIQVCANLHTLMVALQPPYFQQGER